jgi:hypothetical protein
MSPGGTDVQIADDWVSAEVILKLYDSTLGMIRRPLPLAARGMRRIVCMGFPGLKVKSALISYVGGVVEPRADARVNRKTLVSVLR